MSHRQAPLVLCTFALAFAVEAAAAPSPDVDHFATDVSPFLAVHCEQCHAGDKPKGDFHIDALTADFGDRGVRDRWLAAAERVKAGEMPPAKAKSHPSDADARQFTDRVGKHVELAAA